VAAFTEDAELEHPLDYVLLREGGVALYFAEHVLADAIAWLRERHYLVHELDCTSWQSEADFHRSVAIELGFPDYYGANLNAFNDCLGDVPIPPDGGVALVFRHFDRFASSYARCARDILDIAARTSRQKSLVGRRFLTLVQSDDPRLSFAPIGAVSACWNPSEWLNAKRGL
jgi:RNAse (barnase) inhibitor barstar